MFKTCIFKMLQNVIITVPHFLFILLQSQAHHDLDDAVFPDEPGM